jgi:DNA-binding CsgD family transcriptional regulator/tetratricopeptide (TPR) repeat protein
MVGRDTELRAVEQALEAARAGHGGAVFVIGESGIGKSRLAAAARDSGFAAGMELLRGRGSSVGPMVPFRSLTEALMSLVRSGTPVDVGELGPYRPVLARLVPDWGPPAAEDGNSLVVLAEGVLRLAGLVGRERGSLLILEDMQEFDAETLAVVEYLADNVAQQPMMLLGTVRADPSQALGLAQSAAQRGSAVLLELRRLDEGSVRGLVASCLGADPGDVPDPVTEQVWAGSDGVPLLAEEILSGMIADRVLLHGPEGWRVTGRPRAKVPATLSRAMTGRLNMIGAAGREVLSVAAVLGRRFPLTVLQEATGMGERDLLSHLHAEPASQLVTPDDQTPDWYAFQHGLIADVIVGQLTPAERNRIIRRAAAAVETVYPALPGEWCQISAALHLQAGDLARAGVLFAEAGRRALAQGAASSAVTLLDEALRLLAREGDAQSRADAFASLLYALAEAGLVERAVASAGELDQVAGLLSPDARAHLHTRLAWAAAVAGRARDGLEQVEIARRLLGPDAASRDTAAIDVVAAHLLLDLPGRDQLETAGALARRAASAAETARLPLVACRAWRLLGALNELKNPDWATACLEQARRTAVRNGLPIEEIHTLIRLGTDDALRHGSLVRLEQAQAKASQCGAVTARYQAELCIALQRVLRGEFDAAKTLIDQALASTTRLRLLETSRYALLVRAVLGAHQGRRRDMDAALAEMRQWEGVLPQHVPRVHGLARAWCALLEEDRARAMDEMAAALEAEERSPTIFQLTERWGLRLLLHVLAGTTDAPVRQAVSVPPPSQIRWDRQFVLFARAVLAGRAGQGTRAAEAVAQAVAVGELYPTARHIGLRLVSEAAVADGWGEPAEWLRAAEDYFHVHEVPAVASACRALMRQVGVPVSQHRQGVQDIPSALRTARVTVREYEILQLLVKRLSNREIAARLHLSPRTVEKHVASLIAKTGQRDRIALSEFGSAVR